MSRRKSNVTKRSEYVALSSDEESSIKVQTRKRKHEIDLDSNPSDESDWETLQSSPKMVKVNRQKPSNRRSVVDHDYEMNDGKKHCTNKNALMARQNRIKKKIYVEKLENTIEELKKNYESMQKQITEQNEVIARVTKENKYLRNVITNSSGLKQILQGVRLAGLANQRSNQTVHSTTEIADPNLNQQKVTEESHPSSTTSDPCADLDNLKWEMLHGVKPDIPVHDFSSNPQLYYDTVPEHRRRQKRDDLHI